MSLSYSHKSLFNAAVPVIRADGHYDILEKEVLEIQKLFQDIKDEFGVSDEERSRIIGHYGLGGEFGNGVGPAIKNYIRQFEPIIEEQDSPIVSENAGLIHKAFNHFAASFYDKPSQRAKYSEESGIAHEEKAGPALQRSLIEMQDWVKKARQQLDTISPERRDFVDYRLDKIGKSLNICEEALENIEKFAQTTSIYAAAHNIQVKSLERDEMRALFSLNKTIAQKLDS